MKLGDRDGHGRYGQLDEDSDGLLCHECGGRYRSLGAHAYGSHGMTADEYRAAHGIPRRISLVTTAVRETLSQNAKSHIGSDGWNRMVEKRDPTAASHARTEESFRRRGEDKIASTETAKRNIKGVRKPVTRRCVVCDSLIVGRKGLKTCSPLCQRISGYEGRKRASAEKWAEMHDAGESWSAIGRLYGVSHTAVREAVKTYRRYLSDREYLAEHGPGEVPENRENA